jgi:hypothetical protein
VALNKTAEKAREAVRTDMTKVFDRPTPFVINSLRVKYATKTNLRAEVAFKDKNSAESSRSMVEPHVLGGKRRFKAMEGRLRRMGLLPSGWYAVPGAAAKVDAFGNMGKGQISQLLNVLGTYSESGFNKANAATRGRLAKGGRKSSQYGLYGFAYWVNLVGTKSGSHLAPGVYQRIKTGFGTSLKPVLVFVPATSYSKRLDFFGVVQRTADREFPAEFAKSFKAAVGTALLKSQGALL